jgi:transcriptional regulator with XRE-family HTH domain
MPSHQQIAKDLGLSIATISRLRAGERVPNQKNMAMVSALLNWSVEEQWKLAYHLGTEAWRDEFERRIQQHYDPTLSTGGDSVAAGEAASDTG